MAQGAGTLFWTVMASLLMLAALILFGVPSGAYAHGADHYASQTIAASSANQADHDGCGEHSNKVPASGCCFGAACSMMHSGVTPVGLLLMPPSDGSTVSVPSSLLSEGIGTLPALKPPRASV
jgi:hypothetical protein